MRNPEELTNDEIVQIYGEHQEEIDVIWAADDGLTLKQATLLWLSKSQQKE